MNLDIKEQAERFLDDIKELDFSKADAKTNLLLQIESYDQKFRDLHDVKTNKQLFKEFSRSNNNILVPDEGTELQKYMRHTFVADASVFGEYQHLMRQAKVPEYVPPPPPPPPPEPEETKLHLQFMRPPNNFQDSQVNQRTYAKYPAQGYSLISQSEYHRPLIDNNSLSFYQYQLKILQLQSQAVPPPPPDDPDVKLRDALKQNINRLGGIEDTVGMMQNSLINNEYHNMTSRQYRQFMEVTPLSEVQLKNNVFNSPQIQDFYYYPQDQQVLQNGSNIMHALTQNLELTQGNHFAPPPMTMQLPSQTNNLESQILPNQQQPIERKLKTLEQSKILRKQKEQQFLSSI